LTPAERETIATKSLRRMIAVSANSCMERRG
jgi:hypothetical protein